MHQKCTAFRISTFLFAIWLISAASNLSSVRQSEAEPELLCFGGMNIKKRQLVCDLSQGDVTIQAGAMQWMLGDVKATTGIKGAGDFFKKTKKSLGDVIKETRSWYILDGFTDKIQGLINNLDFGKFNELIGQLGDVYAQENSETLDIIKEFKDLVK